MADTSQGFELRTSYASLFIGSKNGWAINNNPGERDKNKQKEFSDGLLDAMGSRHKDPQRPEIWCPITGGWCPRSSCTAAHLFPRTAGESAMEVIFRETRDEEGKSDLWKPVCGMMWSTEAEHRFTKGSFTIVLDVADSPTIQEVEAWEKAKVKDYKIRVVNPEDASMSFKIWNQEMTWLQLDGEKVMFLTDWRPKARYLYFAYCEAMLRRSFSKGKHQELLRAELGKRYWGTPGRYLLKGMLLGFVDQMGHVYDHLLEGASNAQTPSTFDAVDAANDHIKERIVTVAKVEDEEGSEEEFLSSCSQQYRDAEMGRPRILRSRRLQA